MIEKNTIQKVAAFFFTFPTTQIHLRELSRKLKLSMPSILSSVKKLQKEGLVIMEKSIALTNVKANIESQKFTRLKRIHNLESLYESGLVDFLIEKCRRPPSIICFGSYSRGDDIETSDLDLAVIGGKEAGKIPEIFEKKIKRTISLHYVKLESISEEFRSNLCNGVVMEGAL